MKFLCDSNIGERDISFAPLEAYLAHDGRVVVVNPLIEERPQPDERDPADRLEVYESIESAAKSRGFIRRYLDLDDGR